MDQITNNQLQTELCNTLGDDFVPDEALIGVKVRFS
jgi:hypothetical protein